MEVCGADILVSAEERQHSGGWMRGEQHVLRKLVSPNDVYTSAESPHWQAGQPDLQEEPGKSKGIIRISLGNTSRPEHKCSMRLNE